jgi:glycosyltransferase involved in cell wall biosynthesis
MTQMLEGETIIYFGPEPWDGLWRNRHQLMSRFATQNKVWYVEPATNLRKMFSGNAKRRSRLFSRDASGVHIFHSPWWLPTTGRAPFRNVSIWIFLAALSIAARTGRKRRPIVWLSRPSMVEYVGKLNAKLTIYHVVDEYSGYGHPSDKPRSKRKGKEDEMLRQADMVIVVTPTLFDNKSPRNPNTYLVPNAVDYDSYADCAIQRPDDMAGIEGPIIGYSGLIAARLDMSLLQDAAESRSDWNFVFVGTVNDAHCESEMQRRGDLPNVHLLGQKPVGEVPRYVHQFDVCVIPYVVNLRAQHASPLKLYEYAAASKPIVTTDFAAARAFQGHVSIAEDLNDFIAACERSLALDSSAPSITENRRFAAENTWKHRVQQISDILRDLVS